MQSHFFSPSSNTAITYHNGGDDQEHKKPPTNNISKEDCTLAEAIITNLTSTMTPEEICIELVRVYQLPSNKDLGIGAKAKNAEGLTPLMAVACKNDSATLSGLQQLIAQQKLKLKDLDINATDKNGRTALIHLTRQAPPNKSILDFLFTQKLDPRVKDKDGKTAVYYAIASGDVETFNAICPRRIALMTTPAWDYTVAEWEALKECHSDKANNMFIDMEGIMPFDEEPNNCLAVIKSIILHTMLCNPDLASEHITYIGRWRKELSGYNQWLQELFVATPSAAAQYPVARTIICNTDKNRIASLPCAPEKLDRLATEAFLKSDRYMLYYLVELRKDICRHLSKDLKTLLAYCKKFPLEELKVNATFFIDYAPIKLALIHAAEQTPPQAADILQFATVYDNACAKSTRHVEMLAEIKVYIAYAVDLLEQRNLDAETLAPLQQWRNKFESTLEAKPSGGGWETTSESDSLVRAAWSGDVVGLEQLIVTYQAQGKLAHVINQEHIHPKTQEKLSPLFAAIKSNHPHAQIIVECLLAQEKIQLDKEDKNKKTALVVAAESGLELVTKILFTAKVKRKKISDKEQQNAVTAAARKGATGIVKHLVEMSTATVLEPVILEAMTKSWPETQAAVAIHTILLDKYLPNKYINPNDKIKTVKTAILRACEANAPVALLQLYIHKINECFPASNDECLVFNSSLIKDCAGKTPDANVRYEIIKVSLSYTPINYVIDEKLAPDLKKIALLTNDFHMMHMLFVHANNKDGYTEYFISHPDLAVKFLQSSEKMNGNRSIRYTELLQFPFGKVIVSAAIHSPQCLLELLEVCLSLQDRDRYYIITGTLRNLSTLIKTEITKLSIITAENQHYIAALNLYAQNAENIFDQKSVAEIGNKMQRQSDALDGVLKSYKDSYVRQIQTNLPLHKKQLLYFLSLLKTNTPLYEIEILFKNCRATVGNTCREAITNNMCTELTTELQTYIKQIADTIDQRKATNVPAPEEKIDGPTSRHLSSTLGIAQSMNIPVDTITNVANNARESHDESMPVQLENTKGNNHDAVDDLVIESNSVNSPS